MVADFIDLLIQNNVLEEKYREDSIYSMTLAVEKVIVCTALFVISLLLGKFFEGVVVTVCFLALRQTIGGFHANSFFCCFMGSVITVVISLEVLVPLLVKHTIVFGVMLLFSIVCIWIFAPVNHPGLMLTLEEQKKYRFWSRRVLMIEIGMSVAGLILKMKWQLYIMMAIIICAVFIIVAKLLRQEVRTDEDRERQCHS